MSIITFKMCWKKAVQFGLIAFICILEMGECIVLEPSRSRMTKTPKVTTPLPADLPTMKSFAAETYKVIGTNGAPCIQMKVDALISIKYNTRLDEREEADLYVHHSPKTEGNCKDDSSIMSIATKGFLLDWYFAKTLGGERWYVESIRLSYNTSVTTLKNAAIKGRRVTLETAHENLLFPTPVGKSYVCDREIVVPLLNSDPSSEVDHEATLSLREMQLQAFMYKKSGNFGAPYSCPLAGENRSESAPIAAGAILALATAAMICGYSAYRYYKHTKTQYTTMA